MYMCVFSGLISIMQQRECLTYLLYFCIFQVAQVHWVSCLFHLCHMYFLLYTVAQLCSKSIICSVAHQYNHFLFWCLHCTTHSIHAQWKLTMIQLIPYVVLCIYWYLSGNTCTCLIGLDLLLAVSADLAMQPQCNTMQDTMCSCAVQPAFVQFTEHAANCTKAHCTPPSHLTFTTMDSDVDSTGTSNQHYNCVCSENFGQPNVVSSATWYCHYQAASSEE